MSSPYRRRARPEEPTEVVPWGPFPARRGPLFAVVPCLFLGVLLTMLGFDKGVLRCERAHNFCGYQRTTFINRRVHPFPLDQLRGARVIEVKSGKSTRSVVQLDLGARKWRMVPTTAAETQRVAAKINDFVKSDAPTFEVRQHNPIWFGLVGIGFLLAGTVLIWSGLRGAGRIRLEVTSDRIRWTRRVFGLRLSKGELRMDAFRDAVRDVVVEWSKRSHFFQHRHELPETFARLRVIDKDGTSRPIVERSFRGHKVHLRAAAELRRVLELPPRPADAQREQDHLAAAARPPETPSSFSGKGGRFAAAWLGMCLGALGGMMLLALFKLIFQSASTSDQITDWDALIGGGGGALTGIIIALRLTRPKEE